MTVSQRSRPAWFHLPPHQIFRRLAIAFGLLFTFLTPPFQSPDEHLHFYRAFQIAEGHLVAERQIGDCYGYSKYFARDTCLGGRLPRSVLITVRQVSQTDLRFNPSQTQQLDDLAAVANLPLNPDDRLFLNFKTTALHAPIPYLPQAAGIALGNVFNLSPLLLMYAGRLGNLAAWSSLVFVAVRACPLNPELLATLALMPMSLFLAASLSVDGLTNGMAFALVGLAVAAATEAPKTPKRSPNPGWLSLLAVLLSLAKLAYFPLALLLLAIPPARWGSRRRYWLGVAGTCLASGLAVAGWSAVVARIYVSLHPELEPTTQIQLVLANPLGFVATLGRTLTTHGLGLAHQYIGVLGWLDTPLPLAWAGLSWLVVLGLVLRSRRGEGGLRWGQRWLLAIAAFASAIVLCSLAYLWNVVGSPTVDGLQGRYFIPIVPVLALALSGRSPPWRRWERALWLGYAIASLTLTALVLGDRFYL